MYNEKLKKQYLDNAKLTVKSKNIIQNIFIKLAPYEEEAGKDISEFTAKELSEVLYRGFSISKQSTFDNFISILNKYKEWIGNAGFEDTKEINEAFLVRKAMVSSPLQLQFVLDQALQPPEFETIDVILRAMFWLRFFGLTEKQAAMVTKENIDFNAMTVNIDNKLFLIESYAVESLKFACESEYIYVMNPAYKEAIKRQRAEGNEILRCFSKMDGSLYNHHRRYLKIFQDRGFPYPPTMNNVWYSGHFYRKFLEEMMGDEPNFRDLALVLAEESNKTELVDENSTSFRRKLISLKREYNLWKLAFPRFTDLKNIFLT